MDLRQLRCFVAVAETCHFGRAADRLHVAQPALSQTIRKLETELGASLFTRTTRQVALTPAGEFLYEEALRVLAAVDDAARGVRRIASGGHGLVRLGFTGTAALTHLSRVVRTVQRELPGVVLEIHSELLTPAQCEGLADRSLDIGLLRPPAPSDEISLRTIDIDPMVVAMPADHPLADKPQVALDDLRNDVFVTYESSDSAVNESVVRACRQAGFVPRREHHAPSTAGLLPLVAAGLGVALVPASVRALPLDGVVFCNAPDAGTIELSLAWLRDLDAPVVQSVLDVLDAELTLDARARGLAEVDLR